MTLTANSLQHCVDSKLMYKGTGSGLLVVIGVRIDRDENSDRKALALRRSCQLPGALNDKVRRHPPCIHREFCSCESSRGPPFISSTPFRGPTASSTDRPLLLRSFVPIDATCQVQWKGRPVFSLIRFQSGSTCTWNRQKELVGRRQLNKGKNDRIGAPGTACHQEEAVEFHLAFSAVSRRIIYTAHGWVHTVNRTFPPSTSSSAHWT
jgi:hypothetical protein